MKIGGLANSCLRCFDRYGAKMTFTYKGSKKYTTAFGGILSLLISIIILGYVYLLLTTPENFKIATSLSNISTQATTGSSNSTSSSNTTSSNNTSNNSSSSNSSSASTINWVTTKMSNKITKHKEYLLGTNYYTTYPYWAYGLAFSKQYDSSNFTVSIYLNVRTSSGYNSYYIPLSYCNSTYIPETDQATINSFPFSYYICQSQTEINFMGDEYSQNFSNLFIYVEKCVGYSYCKSVNDITSYLTGSRFSFVFLNSYYDSSNSTYPIQQYIDYHKEFYIDPSAYRYGLIKLSKTDIVYLNGTKQTIFETESFDTYSSPATSNYIGYIGIVFGQKKYLIQEYLQYQPASTRMLDTTNTTQVTSKSESQAIIDQVKEESSPQQILLSFFNFFAKVGGFCYFMRIVFGSAANCLANKLMKIKIINKLKSSRIKLDRRKSKKNCFYVREQILNIKKR